ncbi:nuclear transport factor 2 family protein [Mycobacterium sp.]|uniref:nuclear transport factor 2 family protein n=1 Tax=Mycobacterium sp. TaxID=1785 RepID=UPI003BAFA891
MQTIYDAAGIGDLAAIERVLADDVVLYEPVHHPAVLAQARPRPGVWRGRDEVIRGVAEVFSALRLTGVDLETLVVDGDRVVGLLDVKDNDVAAKPYSMPLAEVFRVTDGKVTEIRAFYFDISQLGQLVTEQPDLSGSRSS